MSAAAAKPRCETVQFVRIETHDGRMVAVARTLWNADPDCKHELDPNCWSGIRCLKCRGWYCL